MVAKPTKPTYEALLVGDAGRPIAEASQRRRVDYWLKVLPFMLETTMGHPLALVNYSKETGPMPLVRNIKGEPIVIENKDQISDFINRTGKFEKAGTKGFTKGLVTLYYVPSVSGEDIRIATLDFDIKDIDEKEVRPYVKEAAKILERDYGYVVQPFFTGSSWHVVFRKKDCSVIGRYGGIVTKTVTDVTRLQFLSERRL